MPRDEPISAPPILSDAERDQLIETPGPARAAAPVTTSGFVHEGLFVHEGFAARAAQTPDVIAIVFEDRQLTYWQLDVESNQLAHFLRRHGVGPDVLVGICLERSPGLVIGLLGILKAGGAFLPLEPSYPATRLRELQEEARPAFVLTHSELLAKVRQEGMPAICLDTDRDAIAAEPASAPDVRVEEKNLAAVTFTSGSTGRSKAVPRSHGIFFRPAFLARAPFELYDSDRHVLKTALDSTLLGREVFWPLLSGGRIIIARTGESNDAAALLRLLIEHKVTFLTLVPSLLRLLVQEPGFENCTSLRHVTCFGEPLASDLEARFCRCSSAELCSIYGTTEATALALRRCRGSGQRALGNLGYPLSPWRIYILDARLQPVPVGVAGELFAGGPALAEGYLNRDDRTEERFIPNPFSADPGARLYRTGDRARWRSDGSLEFLGRVDDQIKIRGYRVEPAEVESALLRHAAVREAAVAARPNRAGEQQLVAYLVAPSPALTVDELRADLRSRLPDHMIPSTFVRLDELPRRPNGKLDRKALADAVGHLLELAVPRVAPRTKVERKLTDLWRDALEIECIGLDDDFFLLGGNSLIAAGLIARMRLSCGVDVALRDLFEAPTIARLLDLIERRSSRPRLESDDLAAKPSEEVAERQRSSGRTKIDPEPFCEVMRPGMGGIQVVCVGDTRPIPFLLSRLPPRMEVLHLKLDGTHVWPPRFLTIEEQVDVFASALRLHGDRRPVALVGYSYGGVLAHRLASRLLEEGRPVADVTLLEPGAPSRHRSLWTRWRLRLRNLIQWCGMRSSALPAALRGSGSPLSPPLDGQPDIHERWDRMAEHYRRNVETAQPRCLRIRVALVGSARYHARFGDAWRRIEPDGLDPCILSGAPDHFSCFREPHAGRWLDSLEERYRRLRSPDNEAIAPGQSRR